MWTELFRSKGVPIRGGGGGYCIFKPVVQTHWMLQNCEFSFQENNIVSDMFRLAGGRYELLQWEPERDIELFWGC